MLPSPKTLQSKNFLSSALHSTNQNSDFCTATHSHSHSLTHSMSLHLIHCTAQRRASVNVSSSETPNFLCCCRCCCDPPISALSKFQAPRTKWLPSLKSPLRSVPRQVGAILPPAEESSNTASFSCRAAFYYLLQHAQLQLPSRPSYLATQPHFPRMPLSTRFHLLDSHLVSPNLELP